MSALRRLCRRCSPDAGDACTSLVQSVDRPRRRRPDQLGPGIPVGSACHLSLPQMLDSMKLTSVASKDADLHYIGALYVPGVQLIVVAAKCSATDRMNYLLSMKEYRDAYVDLNSASRARVANVSSPISAPTVCSSNARRISRSTWSTSAGKSMSFDGEWGGKDNVSREEYTKTYESTDEQYTQMLQALIEVLKKSS